MERRSFLKVVGGTVGGCAVASGLGAGEGTADPPRQVPRRELGKTGEKVSVVGFPGFAMVHGDQERCNAVVKAAFARGVNYFDVAPAYGNGEAETKLGIALEGLDRSRLFLACKTKMRDKEGARVELERSLKRLKTDRFDLYQIHAIFEPEEVEEALGPGGAMETFLEAKKEGKVRFLGFSAHTTRAALAAMKGFRFDSVMFPVNFVELFTIGFGKQVLDLAKEQGAGVLAIKPMARGAWLKGEEEARKKRNWWYPSMETPEDIALAIRFTLSHEPVASAIPPAWLDLLEKAVDGPDLDRKVTEDEIATLRALAATRESIFRKDEQKVALAPGRGRALDLGDPYRGCPGAPV